MKSQIEFALAHPVFDPQRQIVDAIFDRCSPVPVCGCWLWMGALKGAGYAQMAFGRRRSVSAHIVAYQAKYGPVPVGLELDHKCRVRSCVNPDHLEPVTHAENIRRGDGPNIARRLVQKLHCEKRARMYCKRGHQFTPENTWIGKSGSRFCRACRSARGN